MLLRNRGPSSEFSVLRVGLEVNDFQGHNERQRNWENILKRFAVGAMDIKLLTEAVSAVATVIIAGTGVWALIYASKQLNQSRETEKVKHLVEFTREFDSEPMSKWRKTVAEERLKGVNYPEEGQRLLDFFETIGLLVRRGYLDENDVWSTFSYWMFNIYADFREDIEQMRRDDESYYHVPSPSEVLLTCCTAWCVDLSPGLHAIHRF